MCGGAPLAGVEVPAVTQKVMEVTMWPEKKKSQWGGGGGRRFTGHSGRMGLRLDNDEEDFETDFDKFEANSTDYDLELRLGRVAEKDDDDEVMEIKPFAAVKRSLSQGTMPTASFDGPSERPTKRKRKNQFRGIRPAGSADFASNKPLVLAMNFAAPVEAPFMHMYSDQGSNSFGSSDTKTPDISSIAPIFAITDEAESALVKSNTYNSVVPPVIENNAVNLEPWMRYLMDDGVDELIDSLLNFDVPQDVIENMDLWSFDDMPICGEFFRGIQT